MSEAQLRRISYLRSIVKDKDAEIEHQAARIEQLEAALREAGCDHCRHWFDRAALDTPA